MCGPASPTHCHQAEHDMDNLRPVDVLSKGPTAWNMNWNNHGVPISDFRFVSGMICVYSYIYIYIYTYTCDCMYVHVCIYIYTYIHVRIYIYIIYIHIFIYLPFLICLFFWGTSRRWFVSWEPPGDPSPRSGGHCQTTQEAQRRCWVGWYHG